MMLKVGNHKEGGREVAWYGGFTCERALGALCVAAGHKFVSNAVCTCCCADVSFHQAQNLASHSAF